MKKYIGNKDFYKMVIALVIPIMIQQGITNFVNLIDNVMVGRLGTEPMSGVAIVNQLIFVFNLTIFGCISGASIFGAQFFGNKDYDGVKYTFRFKMILGAIACVIVTFVFIIFGENLINLYITESSDSVVNSLHTLTYAKEYLKILIWGLVPFMISQSYSTTLREAGETMLPMIGSTISIGVNLVLNFVLIFGYLGFPTLGVKGAAIATVIARYIEMLYIVIVSHKNDDKFVFFYKVYKSLYIPWSIVKKILITGTPLLINEMMFSIGSAGITQSYAVRGLNVMAAFNISSTVSNLFLVILFSLGSAISILVGQQLGAGEIEKAKDTDRKLIFFSVSLYVVIGAILFIAASYIPYIYKTEGVVRNLATSFLRIYAVSLPLQAFNHGAYFTMRSGGKTILTFCFDSLYICVINLPLAYVLTRFTSLNIKVLYAIVLSSDIIKATIGFILIKSGIWANNIIDNK
ncbi:MATE family efflux transporter [Sedimentibacter sp. zth1]|uniref:MATE family efflux transporter n=1 Tax=Sedimentibacter sp. zth1 TaxID=2816908 RepID=UPI001A93A47A|nr:MATE family efflux transporter [Sedimentibacter sp. zth1]QSX04847.1 MATE family efflux transporter [Sedimentibacter sp. zth1]